MDLLNLAPTKISRDLEGTTWLIYAPAKAGKTTLASTFPKPLFLTTEKGLNALPGVYAQPINSWAEFKTAVNQLARKEVRERYDTIVIDTLTNLIEWLDLYIGSQLSTDKEVYKYGTDVPYGRGTARVGKELNEMLQKLVKHNYTIVTIAHAEEKTNFNTKQAMMTTSLDKKPGLVIDRFVDNILFLDNIELRDGTVERRLHFRGTNNFKAGSRYKYVPDYCLATYEDLKAAVLQAIDQQEQETPGMVTSASRADLEQNYKTPEYDFEALITEFNSITQNLMAADPNNQNKIVEIVENELGTGRRVSQLNKNQAELLFVIINELKRKMVDEKEND